VRRGRVPGSVNCGNEPLRVPSCAVPDVYLAIDIGGSKLTAGIVDDRGVVLVRDRVPTPPRDVWPVLARLVRRVMAAAPSVPVACGVGCSGPIVRAAGTVAPLAIPSWRGFQLRSLMADLSGVPTVVDVDAKALVLGEVWCGAARGVTDVIGVTMSTVVSGGIISGGRLLHGRVGNAGGIGHVVVEPEGRPCACGGLGCLDAYCSRAVIEEETGRVAQRAPRAIVERTGTLVGRAVATVAAVVDLRLCVVGGSLGLGYGEALLDAAQHEVDARARLSHLAPRSDARPDPRSDTPAHPVAPATSVRFVAAANGPHAPLIGAAALARFYGHGDTAERPARPADGTAEHPGSHAAEPSDTRG
jgi:glucokinase